MFLWHYFFGVAWLCIVWLCGVSIFRIWQFISFSLLLFDNSRCVCYSVIILFICFVTRCEIFTPALLEFALQPPQIWRNIQSILANHNKVVILMVSSFPFISDSSCRFFHTFEEGSKCANSNWYHRHPHVLYLSQFTDKVQMFANLSFFFLFSCCASAERQNPKAYSFFFFFVSNIWSGLWVRMRWSFVISKSPEVLCFSFFWTDSSFSYHLVVWLKFSILQDSHWIIFPPNHVYSCILSLLVCYFHLLWNKLF